MRSPALLAIALLAAVGLSGCDLSKLKDAAAAPQPGASAQTSTAQGSTALASCPTNTKMVCQPLTRPSTLAAPTMSPEKAKANTAGHGGYVRKVAWRAASRHGQQTARNAVAERRVVVIRRYIDVPVERRVVEHRVIERHVVESPVIERPAIERRVIERPMIERPVIERHVYVDTYAERPLPPLPPREYARPQQDRYVESHVQRQASEEARYRYERESSDQGGYRYEQGARYEQGDRYGAGASYERRDTSHGGGSSSSYGQGDDDCGCRTAAAGRDRQGFLTWPGKR